MGKRLKRIGQRNQGVRVDTERGVLGFPVIGVCEGEGNIEIEYRNIDREGVALSESGLENSGGPGGGLLARVEWPGEPYRVP